MTGEGRHPDRVPLRDWAASLPPKAIGPDVHKLEEPIAVTAWIFDRRHGWHLVDAIAEAWTSRAGHITYTDEHGRTGNCWVWASSIQRRPERPG